MFYKMMVIASLFFLASTGWACEDYESCKKFSQQCYSMPICKYQSETDDRNCAVDLEEQHFYIISSYIEALDYKLAEIEKKMEKKTMIYVPNQPEPSKRIMEDIKFSNGETLSLMTQIVNGSQIVEEDGSTARKDRNYKISRAMGCIYKIEIMDTSD